ncbi:MAG: hypothetical protein OEO83_18755, partial [Alphaproteobacteria bacterium]|nr:hypothetical protein [Alphaproteobacteria bacterium]
MPQGEMPNTFPAEIDLGPRNGVLRFDKRTELLDWVTKEEEAWDWIRKIRDGSLGQVVQIQSEATQQIISHYNSFNPKYEEDKAFLDAIVPVFLDAYVNRKAAISTGPIGKFIFKLKADDQRTAAYALQFLQGNFATNHQSVRGAFIALLFELGLDGSANAEREAFIDLKAEAETLTTRLHEEVAKTSSERDSINENHSETIAAQSKEFEKLLSTATDD